MLVDFFPKFRSHPTNPIGYYIDICWSMELSSVLFAESVPKVGEFIMQYQKRCLHHEEYYVIFGPNVF